MYVAQREQQGGQRHRDGDADGPPNTADVDQQQHDSGDQVEAKDEFLVDARADSQDHLLHEGAVDAAAGRETKLSDDQQRRGQEHTLGQHERHGPALDMP